MLGIIYKIYFKLLSCDLCCLKNRMACVYNKKTNCYDFYYIQVPFIITYWDTCPDKESALFKWKVFLER